MASGGVNARVVSKEKDKPLPAPAPSCSRYPQNTRVIQLFSRPRTVVNHSYVDYSLVPFQVEENKLPTSVKKMDFHQKLHAILCDVDNQHVCTWVRHGRAFRIIDPVEFEKTVCPKFFGHSRYSSFLHQIGIQGYKVLSTRPYRKVYYSQVKTTNDIRPKPETNRLFSQNETFKLFHRFQKLFLRDLPHLTKFMPPPSKVFRHLTQDPDNEPDFDAISLIAPLPTDKRFGRPLTVDDVIEFCRDTKRNEQQVLHQFRVLLQTRGDEVMRQRVEALQFGQL